MAGSEQLMEMLRANELEPFTDALKGEGLSDIQKLHELSRSKTARGDFMQIGRRCNMSTHQIFALYQAATHSLAIKVAATTGSKPRTKSATRYMPGSREVDNARASQHKAGFNGKPSRPRASQVGVGRESGV